MTEEAIRKLCEDLGENFDELTPDDITFIQRCAAAKEFLNGMADVESCRDWERVEGA